MVGRVSQEVILGRRACSGPDPKNTTGGRSESEVPFIQELIEQVRNGTMEVKERAASLLATLAEQNSNADREPLAKKIGMNSGVRPLCVLIRDGSPVAQEHAAAALARVARVNRDYRLQIIHSRALAPLASMLRGGGELQEHAAATVASISDIPEAQQTLMQLGCVPALVEMVRRGSSAAQVSASQALGNIAAHNVEGQTEVHQAGAVKPLLRLLGSGRAQEHAARAIGLVAHRNGTVQVEVVKEQGIAKLLALLSDRNVNAQIEAAAALSELAQGANGLGHRRTQDAISKAGGIAPLLAMVECHPPVVKAIAESVKCLAEVARRNRSNQDEIASSGGIKPLVELLQHGTSHVFDTAGLALCQANASLAITEICRRNPDNQSAVANMGGISQLVTLLHKGNTDVQAEIAGAMWTMSVNHDLNKTSIASANAITPLVALLACENERAQSHAASALASLALGNHNNQQQMTPQLVKLLGSPDDGTMKRAARSLWRIVKENPEDNKHIANSGGAGQLVMLLRDGKPNARKYALWSLSLSIDKEQQKTVSETGGVKPLVASLSSSNTMVTKQAAGALALLAHGNSDAQKEIARAGGIAPLIDLLDCTESEGTREHAAAALSELALIPSNKTTIDRAGAISPLVALLLYDGAQNSKRHAATALARLSTDHNGNAVASSLQPMPSKRETNQKRLTKAEMIAEEGAISPLVNLLSGGRGEDAQEASAFALWALASDSGNRALITELGGIGPLVLLLGCNNRKAREHAEAALVRLSIEVTNRELIIKQLVSMLNDSGTAAQEQAAAALANLARDSDDNRTSIVDAGGIIPLLRLLGTDSSPRAKENSASAIGCLCVTTENQESIADAGGITLLVGVLQGSSSNVKETSAITLCSLTAMAIWKLVKNNKANQLAVAEAGAITALVTMLGSPSAEMQANAAGALSTLAEGNQENQSAIARTGAIAPLCTLVREGSQETKEMCAAALWSLSTENAPNKATIAKLGGVEPLVGLLVSGASEKSQEYAAGALASLASKHSENRAAIAKRLVGLLNGRQVERAVRVLNALSSLSDDHPANQIAIAKAGGVPPIITWMGSTSEEAQREAAHAVLAIAANNATTQVLISKSGGIPPLVAIIAKSSVEAQEYAARALWHLASNAENQMAIAEAKGIEPLVGMLSADGETAPELAAVTIVRLAANNAEVSQSIATCYGITPLVRLLTNGSAAAQQQAASALSELALLDRNREEIAQAGGIEPLIRLLTSATVGTPETAARALAHLARDNVADDAIDSCGDSEDSPEEDNDQDQCSDDDQVQSESSTPPDQREKHVGNAAETIATPAQVDCRTGISTAKQSSPTDGTYDGPTRRAEIKRAGGIHKLIAMLDNGIASNQMGGRRSSATPQQLWNKVQQVVKADNDVGGAVITTIRLGVQEQAAEALCDLANGDSGMQDAIIEAGGVPPLLVLVNTGSAIAQEHAARALWYLSSCIDNQQGIVDEGCIPALVALVRNGSPNAQEVAAAGLAELAKGAIERHARTKSQQGAMIQRRRISREVAPEDAMPAGQVTPNNSERLSPSEDHHGLPSTSALFTPISIAVNKSSAPHPQRQDMEENGAIKEDLHPSVPDEHPTAPVTRELSASETTNAVSHANMHPQANEADALRASSGANALSREASASDAESDCLIMITEAGGITPLVSLLSSGGMVAKEKAAAALWHLALNSDNQLLIAKANGVTPLVALLDDGSMEAVDYASKALARLAQISAENQALIAKRLVSLLTSDNTGAQERSATAIWALAKAQPTSPGIIVNAGAISPLVNLLSAGTLWAKQQAAGALSTLGLNNPGNQLAIAIGLVELLGRGDPPAQEAVTKLLLELAGDRDSRQAIAKAGAIHRLVVQLKSPSPMVQELAAACLTHLTADGKRNVDECSAAGGIKPLVTLLSSTSFAAQAHAATVLADMTKGTDERSAENQLSMVKEGGIGPLVLLLNNAGADGKAAAAGALWSLAKGLPETQSAVAEAGAIVPLVKLLKGKHPVQQLKAAGAIAGLSAGSHVNQDAVTAAGGIKPLVQLLSDMLHTNREVQAYAADALSELCSKHADNQTKVADAGAIKPLIELLIPRSSVGDKYSIKAMEMSSGALWSLCSDHFQNQTAVAEADGIQPLVTLLGIGSDEAQKQAAGALAALALDHKENEHTVSESVMKLLDESSKPSAAHGSCEKAARAISRLADYHVSNQNALARADGVRRLVGLLDARDLRRRAPSPSVRLSREIMNEVPPRESHTRKKAAEESSGKGDQEPSGIEPAPSESAIIGTWRSPAAQKEIAGALWSMANKNPDNQISIAAVDGIPKLIKLLRGDAMVHRNVAGALWSLADDQSNSRLIAQQDGIAPLVGLLSKGGGRAQETAAGALNSLAVLEANRTAIAEAGGIQPLVETFEGGSAMAVEQAAGALTRMVHENPPNQDAVAESLVQMLDRGSVEAQEHVTVLIRRLCDQSEMRGTIAKFGGVGQLVRQLKDASDAVQSQAAKALSLIALKSAMLRVKVTQQLVGLLGSEVEETRKRAGVALRDMASTGGDESQKMVAMAGGVAPLVSLLKDGLADGRVEAQEYALWSLSLATDQASRSTIVKEGCIALLIQSLQTGQLPTLAQEHAASVLAGLARDVEHRDEITDATQDGISPLVGLLAGDSSVGAKKHAATALARLALDSSLTQAKIAAAGAIKSLVAWLTDKSLGQGMAELAARSLADIASDNAETSLEVVAAGAIVPLVAMLANGKGNDAQKSAAGALATLTKADHTMAPSMKPGISTVAEDNNGGKATDDTEAPVAISAVGSDEANIEASAEIVLSAPRIEPIALQVAGAGGIPPLVELLKSERVGPHENASRAIWQLAHAAENQQSIATAGGIEPLVALLSAGSESTQRHSAGAMESMAKDCPENQIMLAKAKAIAPLVSLLGSENMETQEHSVGALLHLASHIDCRNAVVRRLVAVLDLRNASAQMRAAGALAVLSSRNVTYRNAIMEAGAVPPLVRQLGDGLRVENDTPQERAACVLADLARSAEAKVVIGECLGVEPLVRMLSSTSDMAQTAASIALGHLSCNGGNKISIVNSGGIGSLVAVLADDNRDAKRHAILALCQLSSNSENKMEIVNARGIPLLVQVMKSDAQTLESAAAVLSELSRSQLPQKHAIVDAGGIEVIASALKDGPPGAQKHAAAAFWGLAAVAEFKRLIVDAGAVPPLVALLRNAGEAQGYATATLALLAEIGEGKKHIFTSLGVEPLLEIAKDVEKTWLRSQAVEVLTYLNIKDPLAQAGFQPTSPTLSPRTPRGGAASARGSVTQPGSPDDGLASGQSGAAVESEPWVPPVDAATFLMRIATRAVVEVKGEKPLQLRAGFDLGSEKAGELVPKRSVHVLEERMTDDGKTRMCVALEGSLKPLGWVTGSAADGKKNIKEAGRPVMNVVAPKALVAREEFDLASPKVKELASGTTVHVLETRKTSDGAHRISYAFEGKDVLKGWVTAIAKDGALNLNIDVAEARRVTMMVPSSSPERLEEKEEDKDELSPLAFPRSKAKSIPALEDDAPWASSTEHDSFDQMLRSAIDSDVVVDATANSPSPSARRNNLMPDSTSEPGLKQSSMSSLVAGEPQLTARRSSIDSAISVSNGVKPLNSSRPASNLATALAESVGMHDGSMVSVPGSASDACASRRPISSKPLVSLGVTPRSVLGSTPRTAPSTTPRATPSVTPRSQSVSTTPRTATGITPRTALGTAPRVPSARAVNAATKDAQELFIASSKLKMRTGCELDSNEAGTLPAGSRVSIVGHGELPDGTKRAQVARERDSTPLGWVSCHAKDGRENLVVTETRNPGSPGNESSIRLDQVASMSSFASSKQPPPALALPAGNAAALGRVPKLTPPVGGMPFLPPNASHGNLTARSTAKAAATAGAAKAALSSSTVAAAAAAAKEAVAAQVAAEQAAAIEATQQRRLFQPPVAGAPAAAIAAAMLALPGHAGSSLQLFSRQRDGRSSPRQALSSPRASPRSERATTPTTPGRSTPTTPGRSPGTPGRSASRSSFGSPRRSMAPST